MKTAKEWKLIKAHRCLKCGGKCKEDKTKRMVIGKFWYCPKCDGKPVALMKRRALSWIGKERVKNLS